MWWMGEGRSRAGGGPLKGGEAGLETVTTTSCPLSPVSSSSLLLSSSYCQSAKNSSYLATSCTWARLLLLLLFLLLLRVFVHPHLSACP